MTPPEDTPTTPANRRPPAKKVAAKKVAAKKVAAKKVAAKKVAAKKVAVPKKAAARKVAPKKAAPRTVAVRKVAAKKSTAAVAVEPAAVAERRPPDTTRDLPTGEASSEEIAGPPSSKVTISTVAPPPPPSNGPPSGSSDTPPAPPPPHAWAPPPGTQPPGAPPGATGAPGSGPHWSTVPAPKNVGLAIASFVLALVSIVLFVFVLPAVLAVVFGFIALHIIKKNPPRKGRGLAIAGVVIGIVVALGGIAFDIGVGVLFSKSTSYSDLEAGDCIKNPGTGQVLLLRRQNCSSAHEREVYATLDDPASSSAPYPGTTPLRTLAEGECTTRFAAIAGSIPNRASLRVYFLVPNQASWQDDDNRRIVCMVGSADGSPLTGSLPGIAR